MAAKSLMIQGTASSVGKSILVAAFCRIFKQDGLKVAPFKSQNMSLNSYVTREGGEIGRAQAVQAEAAGIEPTVDLNPILLKPEQDSRCQVVVRGKPALTSLARDYYRHTLSLLPVVEDSLARLMSCYEAVIIEGAGSPAEINLQEWEIANMRVARLAQSPVLLVGDIDKGGVFASLVGTLALLKEEDKQRIKGFIINKFRGEMSLLQSGLDFLEVQTGIPVVGVVPYFHDIFIAQEDSIFRPDHYSSKEERIDIAVIYFPRISNSTDFEPLQREPGVRLRYVSSTAELKWPDAIILPGTKSTMDDLAFLRKEGLDSAIVQRAKEGMPIIGICGGYQMLGRTIHDPHQVESPQTEAPGLGLLDMETVFSPQKTTSQVQALVVKDEGLFSGMKGQEIVGYEIHMGHSRTENQPLFQIVHRPDGREGDFDGSIKGNIWGTYVHGLFHNANLRQNFLRVLAERKGLPLSAHARAFGDEQYERLAELVRQHTNMDLIYEICGLKQKEKLIGKARGYPS